jgi:hypothetical protein
MKPLLLSVCLLWSLSTVAQNVYPEKVCDLPAELNETSGLVKIGPNKFVTHNDSGAEPILYIFDSSGVINRRIRISNASNIDWEDLCIDSKGNLWVGDFGNNANDRQNLKIYMISSPNTFTKDTVVASITSFTYSDQKAFPPSAALQNFDMEAFTWYNDTLYLFSKDRTNPFLGYTKCYKLPARAGTYTATPIDSFYTGSGGFLTYSVTGAAIHPSSNQLILMGYDKCWVFTGFGANKFFRGIKRTFLFPSLSQREAVCFENGSKIWYTQENSPLGTVGLYKMDIPPYSPTGEAERIKKHYKIFPVPASSKLLIEVADEIATPGMLLEIISPDGKMVLTNEIEMSVKNEISISTLKPGKYFIRINGLSAGSFVKIAEQ